MIRSQTVSSGFLYGFLDHCPGSNAVAAPALSTASLDPLTAVCSLCHDYFTFQSVSRFTSPFSADLGSAALPAAAARQLLPRPSQPHLPRAAMLRLVYHCAALLPLAHALVAPSSGSFQVLKRIPVAGGTLTRFSHQSSETKTTMTGAVFMPPGVEYAEEVPALYWLSGLTCTDENFCAKAGAFAHAARQRLALVMPDTSPRGAGVPGEEDAYDLGTGAGFYIDATASPWAENYR